MDARSSMVNIALPLQERMPQGHHDCLEKFPPHQVVDAIISMPDKGRSRLSLLFKRLELSAF